MEFLEWVALVFNDIFDFVSGFISDTLAPLFIGCQKRGEILIHYCESVFVGVTYSNYITFFFGAVFTIMLIKLCIRLLRG